LKNVIKISGDKEIKLIDEIHNSDFHADREIEQDLSVIDRGEEMNEANHEFDLKTATEWNALGNSHLKAGAYNDAIVAYTKAIELSPNACWPYIQNLAYVHYQKGKAKGKLSIGKMEDPDIWEGEDEPDSASLFGFETIPNSEQNEAILEPGLEKPNRNNVTSEPVANPDTGMAKLNISKSCESCPNEKNVTILVPAEEASNSLTGISNTKNKVIQKVESEVNVPFQNLNPPLPVEDTPQNSIDWNELGNSYAASRKYDNAIEAYKKAIEMNPKYCQPYRNLCHLYYRLKKYDVAVQLYKRSIDLLDTQEEKAVSWNRLGDTYRRMGDYGNASAAYQRAGEMGPAVSTVMARARATLLENIVAG
jgi:tetratricopeptide (TPR) repeat protein